MAITFNNLGTKTCNVYFFDSSAGTYTQRTSTGYDLLDDTFDDGDMMIFTADPGNELAPWCGGLRFDIATGIAASAYTYHWEYKNSVTGSWVTLGATHGFYDNTNGLSATGVNDIGFVMGKLEGWQRGSGDSTSISAIRFVIDSVDTPTEGGKMTTGKGIYNLTGSLSSDANFTFADLYSAETSGGWGTMTKVGNNTYVMYVPIDTTGAGTTLTTTNENIIFIAPFRYWGMINNINTLTSGSFDSSNKCGKDGTNWYADKLGSTLGSTAPPAAVKLQCSTYNIYDSYFPKGKNRLDYVFIGADYVSATLNWYDNKFYYTWMNSIGVGNIALVRNSFRKSNWERLDNGGVYGLTHQDSGMRTYDNNPFLVNESTLNGALDFRRNSILNFLDCTFNNITYSGESNATINTRYSVLIRAIDASGNPISGATLTVANTTPTTVITATSNADGYFGETSGTASAGGSKTLTDSTKSWTTNAYQSGVIMITSGTGAGQVRGIISHTGTVITVERPWDTNPAADSKYVVIGSIITYSIQGNGTLGTSYNNFTFNISKSGYQTIIFSGITVSEKIRWNLEMKPALAYAFVE